MNLLKGCNIFYFKMLEIAIHSPWENAAIWLVMRVWGRWGQGAALMDERAAGSFKNCLPHLIWEMPVHLYEQLAALPRWWRS